MKLNVVGFEISQGLSKKDGKPYSIGKLHCLFPLAGVNKEGNIARGASVKEFRVEVPILQKVADMQCPCVMDAEMAEVMRFGELSQDIVSLRPQAAPQPVAGRAVAPAH